MQGQQVQAQLQVVTLVQHRRDHRPGVVGLIVAAQPVGFVVRHVIATLMFKRQVDEAFEHAVQLVGGQYGTRCPTQRVLPHQRIKALNVHCATGKPELHFDLIGAQGREFALGTVESQWCIQIATQPGGQWLNPGFPIAQVAASGDGVMQVFSTSSRLGEAFAPGPFEQPVQKSAWARTPREAVNPGPCRQGFNFVFLQQVRFQRGRRLKADTLLCPHQDIAVSNGQGRVTGNPPVRRQLVQRAQCRPH
ncbi:hypothetical protein D3C80_487890 [compost metagenome]